LKRGERFVDYIMDYDIFCNKREFVELRTKVKKKLVIFKNEEQGTVKYLFLNRSLPDIVQKIIGK
jgi:hypothetical protein